MSLWRLALFGSRVATCCPLPAEISVPNLRGIRKEAVGPSTGAAMGRDGKCGEVPQSNDDRNEDKAKRVCDVDGGRRQR